MQLNKIIPKYPLLTWYSRYRVSKLHKLANNAYANQEKELLVLTQAAYNTHFGKDHSFQTIKSYRDFKKQVPISSYETLSPYIKQIHKNKVDVLWSGRPVGLGLTSGTTSGNDKRIPVTSESLKVYKRTVMDQLLSYIGTSDNAGVLFGKQLFLSSTPVVTKIHDMPVAAISGLTTHLTSSFIRSRMLPSKQVSVVVDWEEKQSAMLEECLGQDIRLVAGIPIWIQAFFDRIIEYTGKSVGEVFPNLSLIIYGGVNVTPYKQQLLKSIGRKIDFLENYVATEAFIAYQDSVEQVGMLLNLSGGIFYEFVPVEEIDFKNPTRLNLQEVKLEQSYVILLTTNGGLWAYDIGDTIKFTSLNPFRITVTGRTAHFVSAFGEHMTIEQVERVIKHACSLQADASVKEFTVAPNIKFDNLSYHDWYIEFSHSPENRKKFTTDIDFKLKSISHIYRALRERSIIGEPKIHYMKENTFKNYMQSIGKLGGQNKVPRLQNNRNIADVLEKYCLRKEI